MQVAKQVSPTKSVNVTEKRAMVLCLLLYFLEWWSLSGHSAMTGRIFIGIDFVKFGSIDRSRSIQYVGTDYLRRWSTHKVNEAICYSFIYNRVRDTGSNTIRPLSSATYYLNKINVFSSIGTAVSLQLGTHNAMQLYLNKDNCSKICSNICICANWIYSFLQILYWNNYYILDVEISWKRFYVYVA